MVTRALLCVSVLTLAHSLGLAGGAKPFVPKAGGFSVLFAEAPSEHKQSVKTGTGFVDVHLFIHEPKKGESYVVAFSEFPDMAMKGGTDDQRLDNSRHGAVQSVKGKLRTEKKITLGEYPGRDLHIEVDAKTTVRTRLYAVKNRLYQTMVVGLPTFANSKEAERFLDSFQLTK